MVSKEEAKEKVQKLIEKYRKIVDSGKIKEYHEERTKNEFIEPLFEAMGWDVRNSEREDEVIKEDRVFKGRVDYAFRLNGTLKFFLEAKALKGALDEEKSSVQAIDYAYHKKVTWAVVCDFESLRVYNSQWRGKKLFERRFLTLNTSNYIELFDKLWWLSRESFETGILDKEADVIGKRKKSVPIDQQLLSDFMLWRKSLFDNIMKNSLRHVITTEKVEEVVQNILDRLIFIRTCEDRGLEEKVLWQALIESKGSKKSLLHHLREVFTDFDEKYNSKLFVKSESDGVNIDDIILKDIIHGLYESKDEELTYDFSLIDADILGSIYEQYLGHIMKQMPKTTKLKENGVHKKEQGIYYTPTFIVDYIVKNTIGQLIEKKNLTEIQNIKVLDPACGSGSFLIKAFQLLDDDMKKRNGQETVSKNQILKNNIFGVDLDPKAVEIAQLNLLLQAADKRIRLPNLQKNIRCGNSLIDDSEIAGDAAFKWEEEFKEVMQEGGFDVVIGNPPYVRQEELSDIKSYLQKNYEAYNGMADLFVYFFERELNLLKDGGFFGMIVSNKWFRGGYGNNLRKFLTKFWIEQIIDFGDLKVFPDATIYPCIIIMRKISKQNPKIQVCKMDTLKFDSLEKYIKSRSFSVDQRELGEKEWNIQAGRANELIKKIESAGVPLEKYVGSRIYRGILTGLNEAFIIDENTRKELIAEDKKGAEIIKHVLSGSEIKRYRISPKAKHLIFTRRGTDIDIFPAIKNHLKRFEAQLRPKSSTAQKIGRKPGDYKWFEIQDVIAYYKEFEKPKIIWGNLTTKASFYLDEKGFFVNAPGCILPTDSKYVLGILNSKLVSYYLKSICAERQGGFIEQKPVYISKVPIKETTKQEESKISALVNKMLSFNKRLSELGDKKTDERERIEQDIKKTDKEIDELVYKIYGITEEEKKIIEENVK